MHAVAVQDHHRRDARTEERRHRNAREDDARRPDAVAPREDIDEERGEHRAAERRRRDEPRRPRHHQHDKNARQTRTGRNADDVRVCERIAQDGLQDCTRKREIDADERGNNRTRQTDVPEDLRMRRVARPAEDVQDFADGDVNRALGGREDHRKDGEHGKEREQRDSFLHG